MHMIYHPFVYRQAISGKHDTVWRNFLLLEAFLTLSHCVEDRIYEVDADIWKVVASLPSNLVPIFLNLKEHDPKFGRPSSICMGKRYLGRI